MAATLHRPTVSTSEGCIEAVIAVQSLLRSIVAGMDLADAEQVELDTARLRPDGRESPWALGDQPDRRDVTPEAASATIAAKRRLSVVFTDSPQGGGAHRPASIDEAV